MNKFIVKIISTFFYVGYLPFIPGTFGSIAGVLLFYLLKRSNSLTYILFTLTLIILGFLVSAKAERLFNKRDARCIVIDEVSGIFLSLMFIPYDPRLVLIAFVLFRLLDSLKPYPAGWFQNFKGSVGVMGDDIIAGLYTNIIVRVVLRLIFSSPS